MAKTEVLKKFLKKALETDGDLAEVGVYEGGSAIALCQLKGDRILHLFDTWEGMPKGFVFRDLDKKEIYEGLYKADIGICVKKLAPYPEVHFYKGIFPYTAEPIKDKRFCFVHIDIDTYRSTFLALDFFYPRLNIEGMIVIHDYYNGVKAAVDDFLLYREVKFSTCQWDTYAVIQK